MCVFQIPNSNFFKSKDLKKSVSKELFITMLIILLYYEFLKNILIFCYLYFLLQNDQVMSYYRCFMILMKMLQSLQLMGFVHGSDLRDHSAQLSHFIEDTLIL